MDSLTTHHFVAKAQAAFLKSAKLNLEEGTAVIIMDFAENYSFLVQDAVQGFHWENSQATIHPFAVYYRDEDNTVAHISICIISDCMQHNSITVYGFMSAMIKYIKTKIRELKRIQYFSDGCAAQYKNFKNFINLCSHVDDFSVCAEWHFFATCHGKNTCDAIGGTIKRLAARASLQRSVDNQILTPRKLFEWADATVKGIHCLYVSQEEISGHAELQTARFMNAKTVPGTREHHCFLPIDNSTLKMSRVSEDRLTNFSVASVSQTHSTSASQLCPQPTTMNPGQYITCMYDQHWWLGVIIASSSDSEDEVHVKFMHPHGPATSFSWPIRDDLCWVPIPHVLCIVSPPSTGTSGRMYVLPSEITELVSQKCETFLEQLRGQI